PCAAERKTVVSRGAAPRSQKRRSRRSSLADTAVSAEASASRSTLFRRRRHQHGYTGIQPLLLATVSFAREPRNVHSLRSQDDISGTGHIGWGELVRRVF